MIISPIDCAAIEVELQPIVRAELVKKLTKLFCAEMEILCGEVVKDAHAVDDLELDAREPCRKSWRLKIFQ